MSGTPEVPLINTANMQPSEIAVTHLDTSEIDRLYRPDFEANVSALESIASDGIATHEGQRQFEFRAGIEIEFGLGDPANLRSFLAKDLSESKRAETLLEIRNPECIDGEILPSDDKLATFKDDARAFVNGLKSSNAKEERRKQEWLSQIDGFGITELINFRIYSEFSNPTLGDVKPPTGSLQDLDDFSGSQGWIEYRFGNGLLQSGYYDNEGTCELRMAPCLPSEALRRREIIMGRLSEIASEYGVILRSRPKGFEHINLSIFTPDNNGVYQAVIGHNEDKSKLSIDALAGVMAGFQDGLTLNAENMQWDYIFSNMKNFGLHLTVAPTRKTLRVLDGRFELRTLFHDTAQALNWLMGGSMYGISNGAERIKADGYDIPEMKTVYRVHRTDIFDKIRDVQIQRAFEQATPLSDGFYLGVGLVGDRYKVLASAIYADASGKDHLDVFNNLLFSAIKLADDGTPYLPEGSLSERYSHLTDKYKGYIDQIVPEGITSVREEVNNRLKVVRLQPTEAIVGDAQYVVDGRANAMSRIENSEVAGLVMQGGVNSLVGWLEAA